MCSSLAPSVLDVVGGFGLKKPFRLCCPFSAGVPLVGVVMDLDRLSGRLVDVSPSDRFLFVLFAEFAGGTGGAGLGEGCDGKVDAVATSSATCCSKASCSVAEGTSAKFVNGCSSLCSPIDEWVVWAFGREGLRENISLIFLRRSNSGINLPDSGRRSFME